MSLTNKISKSFFNNTTIQKKAGDESYIIPNNSLSKTRFSSTANVGTIKT